MACHKQNQKPREKPKRKTKEERNKEIVDKIARRNFPGIFESELSIHSADWWIEDKHLNVTNIVRSYLIDSKVQMPCEISILGDPRPYLGKILTIDYSIGGKKTQKIFNTI